MSKIMLYQHASCINHGCEALVRTISSQIQKHINRPQIVLKSLNAHQDAFFEIDDISAIEYETKKSFFQYCVYQFNKRTFNSKWIQNNIERNMSCIKTAEQMDAVIAIGGDNYCYSQGKGYWGTDNRIKKLGKKMMLWGCSVEPDEIPGKLGEHLNVFDIITARESITYNALVNNGLGNKTHLVADPAFLLETEEIAFPENWKQNETVGINLSPLVLQCANKQKGKVKKSIYNLIEYILKESSMNIALIYHVANDIDVLKPIYEHFKGTKRILLIDDMSLNCKQLKWYISNCRFFIGARTHATIAAYSTYVPTLVLGYSVKSKGIARDLFGSEDNLVLPVQTFEDSEATIKGFKYLLENEENLKKRLKTIMPEYKEKARISGKLLKELMEK